MPRPRRAGPLVALILLALFACSTEGEDSPTLLDVAPTVTPARQWSGNSIVLVSTAFADANLADLELAVGGHQVEVVRISADSVRITLPDSLPSGGYAITAAIDGPADSVAAVEAVGMSGIRATAIGCSDPVAWPVAAPTGVLMAECSVDSGPVFIPVGEGAAFSYNGLPVGPYAPSTSFRPNVITDRNGRVVELAAGAPTWTLLDSVGQFTRHMYELSEGRWLVTGSHNSYFWEEGVGTYGLLATESPWLLVRSNTPGRATLVLSVATDAVPLIDTDSGIVAATVAEGISSTTAAVFSPDDAVLYLLGRPNWFGPTTLLVVDPDDGTILGRDSTRVGGGALAVHAGTPGWLYELAERDGRWVLRIRNAADLSVIAEPAAGTIPDAAAGGFPVILIDPAAEKAHVFIQRNVGAPFWLDFDLMLP